MSTTEPIRNKHQIRELADYYLKQGQIRNYVLIVMSLHTALRISEAYVKQKLKICENYFFGSTYKTAPKKTSAVFLFQLANL